jgi:hypothetical protein
MSSIICRSVPPGAKLDMTIATGSGAVLDTPRSEQSKCHDDLEQSGSFCLQPATRIACGGSAGAEIGNPLPPECASTYSRCQRSKTTSCHSRSA